MSSLLFFYLLCLTLQSTSGLNLDPLSPTVVSSGIPGDSNIGFGWTIAQHLYSDETKRVLVSAPTRPDGNVTEGGVYSCPFDVSSSCRFEDVFLSTEVNRAGDPFLRGLRTADLNLEGQLMGYSLKSCGGVVIACAPLYVFSESRVMVQGQSYSRSNPSGRCIILNSDLNTTAQAFDERLNENMFLAGLDLEILKNGNDRGFVLSNSFAGPSPHGGQLILSDGISGAEIQDTQRSITPTVSVNSLLGFHLESGRFTQLANLEIVSSSPRSISHFGQVEIFDSTNLGAGPVRSFTGEQADGYFGYDFAVLDLGHGGYNSLAVGCPLCDGEGGRVYIYAHTGDPAAPMIQTTISPPSPSSRGRFGLAVENIGDIDLDGLSDIAVSAPLQDSGTVYVYRGSRSGVVTDDFQTLNALPGTTVFGYSLSGGLDIDGNGYPDLTVGDLSGRSVTTIRGSPLANMTLFVADRKDTLDITGSSDRLCPLEGVMLHCFNITPCFYYQSRLGDIPQIAFQFTLTVDSGRSRVSTYSDGPEGVVLGDPIVSGNLTAPGPGRDNMVCADTMTFALNANFMEVDSIPVRLSVEDAAKLLSLEPDPALACFGNPLHPVLMQYTEGDVQAPLTLEYEITSNINCSAGNPNVCEGEFSIAIGNIMQTEVDSEQIRLASSNEFGFQLTITNEAADTAISPTLIIDLPRQTRLSRTEPALSCNSRMDVSADNSSSTLECALKNPTSSGEMLVLTTFFVFNDTSALLGTQQLVIGYSVRDGGTGNRSTVVPGVVRLEAISEYNLALRIARPVFQATRSAVVFPEVSALSLEQLGPQVTLRIFIQNNRGGSPFPRSTLYIHLPTEVVKGEGSEGVQPVLIPFEVVIPDVGSNVNCSQFEAVSEQLSPRQRPEQSLLPWTGPRPPSSPSCERNGTLQCGTIICTIFDLQPLPEPPTVLTLFARLYSPSIKERKEEVVIASEIRSDTENPRIGNNSIQSSSVTFVLSPGPREVPRECIRYWVVVVSVVIGIFALVLLIIILAMCGVFRRWYKFKMEDDLGMEQTDQELTYQRRTIPPLPQLTNGASPARDHWEEEKQDLGFTDKELDKEREAEEEFQQELREMSTEQRSPTRSPPITPTLNANTDLGEGLETDL